MTEDQIPEEPFFQHVPDSGWLADYMNWTLWSEAPAAFHYFIGCATLGAALGRRAWFDKGYYNVFPNHQLILVAPTGKCRKTSAIQMSVKLMRQLEGINIIANKATPESIAQELSVHSMVGERILAEREAEGVLLAPELAVFLGKQKYNEGLVAFLTDLFDSPDQWEASTKGQGKVPLKNVCLTFLGASTPDWLISAVPSDAFGGGFMSRLLFIAQTDTPRCYPIPQPSPMPKTLLEGLSRLRSTQPREVKFSDPEALEWYSLWYAANKGNIPEDEKMAGYHERKPDHLLRQAMIRALSEGRWTIRVEDLIGGNEALSFLEQSMLETFKWLGVRPVGVDQDKVLKVLRANNGQLHSSELLRKMLNYMSIVQFDITMRTLTSAGLVAEKLQPPDMSKIYRLVE